MNDYTTRVGAGLPYKGKDMYHMPYKRKLDDGKCVECGTEPWPEHVKCPDCEQAEVLWAEAGYVPGHRICPGCGSHWELFTREEDKQWVLRRARFYR